MEIGVAVTIILAIIAGAVAYGRLDNKNDGQSKEIEELFGAVKSIRVWQEEHGRDSTNTRLEIEREMGRIREGTGQTNAKLEAISAQIGEVLRRFTLMEERERRNDRREGHQ